MNEKNPIGIKFIGWFQILGALAIIFTLNVQQTPPFNVRFAVPFVPELIVKIFVGIFAIIIAYGYLKCLKWGYWSMLIYSILFCCISLTQITEYASQPFIGNVIYSAIVALYTISRGKHFIKCSKL
ncbi:MAG: hypothetical protein AB9856_02930 [Cellulosilyticaceae bacterium]